MVNREHLSGNRIYKMRKSVSSNPKKSVSSKKRYWKQKKQTETEKNGIVSTLNP